MHQGVPSQQIQLQPRNRQRKTQPKSGVLIFICSPRHRTGLDSGDHRRLFRDAPNDIRGVVKPECLSDFEELYGREQQGLRVFGQMRALSAPGDVPRPPPVTVGRKERRAPLSQ
jgi:hypothetical protein